MPELFLGTFLRPRHFRSESDLVERNRNNALSTAFTVAMLGNGKTVFDVKSYKITIRFPDNAKVAEKSTIRAPESFLGVLQVTIPILLRHFRYMINSPVQMHRR